MTTGLFEKPLMLICAVILATAPAQEALCTTDSAEPVWVDDSGDATQPHSETPADSAGEEVDEVTGGGSMIPSKRALGDLFERRAYGFSAVTALQIYDDVVDSTEQAIDWIRQIPRGPALHSALSLVPLALVLLLVLLLCLGMRKSRQWAYKAEQRVCIGERAALTRLLRWLVSGAIPLLSPTVVYLLAILIRQVGFPDRTWALLCEKAFLVFLFYRLALVLSRLPELCPAALQEPGRARRMVRFLRLSVRLLVFPLGLYVLLESVDYRPQALSLLDVVIRWLCVGLVIGFFLLRDRLLNLLSSREETLSGRLRRLLERFWPVIGGLSFAAAALWALGFMTAAHFLLVRVYPALLLLLAMGVGFRWLSMFLRARADQPDIDPQQAELLRSLERPVLLVAGYAAILLALSVLSIEDWLVDLVATPLFTLGHTPISLMSLVKAIIVLVGFLAVSKIIRIVLNARIYPRFDVDVGTGYATNMALHYGLVTVGVLLALVELGTNLSAIMVFAGGLGIGIGFGLQQVINNFVSGFILLFGRSIKKGDLITVEDRFGSVDRLTARSVQVKTPDNHELLVPSSTLINSTVINWTLSDPQVRLNLTVGVSYHSDLKLVRDLLIEIGRNHPATVQSRPLKVLVSEFADSAVLMTLLLWYDCRKINEKVLKGEFNFAIWEAFHQHGIEIPFPQRDIHIKTPDPSRPE